MPSQYYIILLHVDSMPCFAPTPKCCPVLWNIPTRSRPLLHNRLLHALRIWLGNRQYYVSDGHLLLSPEFIDNGSIHDYIYVKGHRPEFDQSLLWAQQIAEGMITLHWKDRMV